MRKRMKIIQHRQRGKIDSFFYYDGEVASVKVKGITYSLITSGDVQITIWPKPHRGGKPSEYRGEYGRFEAIREHKLTDAKLRRLDKEDRIEWHYNNWFEVSTLYPGDFTWTCDESCNVVHNYDSAIELLKEYANGDYEPEDEP